MATDTRNSSIQEFVTECSGSTLGLELAKSLHTKLVEVKVRLVFPSPIRPVTDFGYALLLS